MLSKFIFMHCESLITADTTIYEVLVGESARDRKALSLLEYLTADNAFYCAKYDHDVSEFLTLITQSLTGSTKQVGQIPPRHRLRVDEMRKLVLTQMLGFSDSQRPSRFAICQRLRRKSSKCPSNV